MFYNYFKNLLTNGLSSELNPLKIYTPDGKSETLICFVSLLKLFTTLPVISIILIEFTGILNKMLSFTGFARFSSLLDDEKRPR